MHEDFIIVLCLIFNDVKTWTWNQTSCFLWSANKLKLKQVIVFVATLLWESVRMKLTLSKWRLGSPPGLPKLQSSIVGVKTPHIGVLFVSLECYQTVDVENGLTWAIWTYAAQVMTKKGPRVKLPVWLPTIKSR